MPQCCLLLLKIRWDNSTTFQLFVLLWFRHQKLNMQRGSPVGHWWKWGKNQIILWHWHGFFKIFGWLLKNMEDTLRFHGSANGRLDAWHIRISSLFPMICLATVAKKMNSASLDTSAPITRTLYLGMKIGQYIV